MDEVLYGLDNGSMMPILIGSPAWARRMPKFMSGPRPTRLPTARLPPVIAVHCKNRLREICCIVPISFMMCVGTVRQPNDFIKFRSVSSFAGSDRTDSFAAEETGIAQVESDGLAVRLNCTGLQCTLA